MNHNAHIGNALLIGTSASMVPWIGAESTNAYLPGRMPVFSVKSDPQIKDLPVSLSSAEVGQSFRRELFAEIMHEFSDNNDELLARLAR